MMGAQVKKTKTAAEAKRNKSKIESNEAAAPETEFLMIKTEAGKEQKQEIEAVQQAEQEIDKSDDESRKPQTTIIAPNVEERGARRSRLRALRKGLGLTQTEVARAADLGLSTYYALETKYTARKFSEEVFNKVAKVLRTTPQYILFGSASENQASEVGHAGKSMPSNEGGTISAVRLKALITSILEIEDLGAFGKIEEYVRDQKEFMALKQKSAAGTLEQ